MAIGRPPEVASIKPWTAHCAVLLWGYEGATLRS